MSEIENREQPQLEQTNATVKAESTSVDSECGSQKTNSEFGKFKSAEALLAAYNSLEAEFTRKSQRLSELEKEKAVATTVPDVSVVESELQKFLLNNADAVPFADELKSLALQHNGKPEFDVLYKNLALTKLESGQSKKDNPIIKKYVFQDEELKNLVVENYMKELNNQKPPIVINSDLGEKVAGQKPATPQTLREAKILVEKMFS